MATGASDTGGRNLSLITLIALCGMAPITGLAVTGIAPVLPQITAEFADTPNAGLLVRMMMSGLSAATILGALASGFMASRVGQARLLSLMLVLYVVSGAGIYFLDNLYLMVAARCLQGIANGGAGVLAIALITSRVPADRSNHWLGYYSVTGIIGIIFLMMAVGAITESSWRNVFLLFLLGVPVAIMIGFTFRDGEVAGFKKSAETQAAHKASGIPWALTLFAALCGAIVTSVAMYLPYHLADVGYGTPDVVAMLMVVGAGAAAAPALGFGWIRSRLSDIQTFVLSFGINSIGNLIVVASGDLPMIYIGMALGGIGMGALMPNLFSACAAATPLELRTRMLGFVRAGIYAGPLLAQPGLEVVMGISGARAVLIAIAMAGLLGAAISVAGKRMFTPAPAVA